MAGSRAGVGAAALGASAELMALQERVTAANAAVSAAREELAGATRRRRCLHSTGSEAAAAPAAAAANPDDEYERAFMNHVAEAEQQLQSNAAAFATRGVDAANVGLRMGRARAVMDAAKASAAVLLDPGRLAAVREERNEACSGLVRLSAPVQLLAICTLSVVQLWRARGVSRHFNRWATEALEGLPRLVVVAVGETVILLHHHLPMKGVSIGMESGCQQNDCLADG